MYNQQNKVNKEAITNYILIVSAALYLSFPMTRTFLLSFGVYNVVLILPALMTLSYISCVFYKKRRTLLSVDDVLIILLIVGLLVSAAYSTAPKLFGAIGLVFLMGLSYIVGAYLSMLRDRLFFHLLLWATLPIMIVIAVELPDYEFVYSRYFNRSESIYKVSYILSSVFGVIGIMMLWVLRYPFYLKYPLYAFLVFFVAVSSAKFSAVFLIIYSVFATLVTFYNSNAYKNTVFVVFTLLLGLSFIYYYESIVPFIEHTLVRFANFINSKEGRINLIEQSIELISYRPVSGYGLASSITLLDKDTYPHNFILQVWLESGLLALVPMLFITLRGLFLAIRKFRFGSISSSVGFAYVFIVLSFLKSNNFLESQIMFFFYGYLTHISLTSGVVSENRRSAT